MEVIPPFLFELVSRIPPVYAAGQVWALARGRLLLVLCGPGPRREADLQAWADDHYPQAPLILAHPSARVIQLSRQGHPFFARALHNGNLIYGQAPGFQLSPLCFLPLPNPDYSRANGFLTLARTCPREDSSLNLFLLHQCLEQAAMQFISSRTGYRMDSHNLFRLLRFCRAIDQSIPFTLNRTPSTLNHISLLNRAYLAGRYEPGFCPALEDTQHLLTAVSTLLHRLISAHLLTPLPDEESLHAPPAAGL